MFKFSIIGISFSNAKLILQSRLGFKISLTASILVYNNFVQTKNQIK